VIGTATAVFWSLTLILSAIGEAAQGVLWWSLEGALLAALVITSSVGVAIAWRRARLGGGVVAVGGLALCIFAFVTAGFNKGLAMAVSGGPFLVAGALFLAS
jgi:hypothetical protein